MTASGQFSRKLFLPIGKNHCSEMIPSTCNAITSSPIDPFSRIVSIPADRTQPKQRTNDSSIFNTQNVFGKRVMNYLLKNRKIKITQFFARGVCTRIGDGLGSLQHKNPGNGTHFLYNFLGLRTNFFQKFWEYSGSG